jgi:Uma2 family endonuclease
VRRPDVSVYRCLSDDQRLYVGDVVAVVEIVSPDSSYRTDTIDKKAAYAAAGIPVYLIVFLTEAQDGIEQIEEYRLSEGRYHLVCLHTRRLSLTSPIPVEVAFDALISG